MVLESLGVVSAPCAGVGPGHRAPGGILGTLLASCTGPQGPGKRRWLGQRKPHWGDLSAALLQASNSPMAAVTCEMPRLAELAFKACLPDADPGSVQHQQHPHSPGIVRLMTPRQVKPMLLTV